MDRKILDEDKTTILQQFRKNMSDLLQSHHDDRFLLRWLRARDFNIREAEKMLREDFKMRKKSKVDNILQDYELPEVVKSYLSTAFLGLGKSGHAVRFIDVGKWDPKGIVRSLTRQDIILSALYILEGDGQEMEQYNRETGNAVEKSVYVADYSAVRLTQWCNREAFRFCIFITEAYQAHYPESLQCFFGLNTPSIIVYIFNIIVKPFFAENVFQKIKLYSAGDDSYKNELFSLVPKEIVPAYVGGERYDPEGDPTCDGLLHRKEKIPSSLYTKDHMILKTNDPKVQHKIIHERSIFEVEKEIRVPGMILCWEFQTKHHNIKFGLFFKGTEKSSENEAVHRELHVNGNRNAIEELLPVETIECNTMCEQGEYVCMKEGIYILHFDNKYSWLRSKHLFYKVGVYQPDAVTETEQ